ncbi:MAG: murein biosynthesis integral membrane protein MurJ [Patescibacteria group bacterium]
MIKKIFSSQNNTITGAALVLGTASFASRLIGLFRDRIFANQFGAGDALDAYFAAFRVPDLIYNLVIVGALSAGFIPIFMKLLAKEKNGAWRLTNNVINILGLSLIIFCAILFIFTPQLMPYIVPGFAGEKLRTTIVLTRIMFLSPVLLGLSSIVSGVLQSMKSFLIYALTPIMYNLGIIIGAIFFVPLFGLNGLAYGVILGAFLHLAIQLPALFQHGFRYQPMFQVKDPNVIEIGRLMIPRTMGLAAAQFNFLIITILASTLAGGSLAIFNLANNLQYFPVGIIGFSFAIAAFPTLSKLIAENKQEEMISHLSKVVRQILFFIIPITIIMLLLRSQIVRVVFGSGRFDWNDTIQTGNALAFFCLSLFAQCLIPLLTRSFFALQDTWTPFKIAFVSALINIILSLTLKDVYGVVGLALAFSIAMVIQLALLWITLRQKTKTLNELSILHTLFKISIAAIAMALVIQFLKTPLAGIVDMTRFWGILTQGFTAGLVGLLVYAGICLGLKVEEVFELKESIKKKWLKLTDIQGEINEANDV